MTTFEANFPTSEYLRRITKTRAEMQVRGLDAIRAFSPRPVDVVMMSPPFVGLAPSLARFMAGMVTV